MHRKRSTPRVTLVCDYCGITFTRKQSDAAKTRGLLVYCGKPCSNRAQAAEPRVCAVYRITHLPSGRFYVGGTTDLRGRWRKHRGQLRRGEHPNAALQAAWASDGPESFAFDICEVIADVIGLLDAEQRWIDQLQSADPSFGFNLHPIAGSAAGYVMPADKGANLRRGQPGKKHPDEMRARLSALAKGRTHRPESKKKMSEQRRGANHWKAKVTEQNVAVILERLAGGESAPAIARDLGIGASTVYRVKHGEHWLHATASVASE